ncbi:unnamed protein product [Dracunculus medinensis]|uniref:CLASP_N domain-containing protein n=1 Tax=Dracunculus medinensis TaxID=318479 RepID=A0A0N4UGT4_DRAME|nr:unnamed protein product [Dracunculus medinensis]
MAQFANGKLNLREIIGSMVQDISLVPQVLLKLSMDDVFLQKIVRGLLNKLMLEKSFHKIKQLLQSKCADLILGNCGCPRAVLEVVLNRDSSKRVMECAILLFAALYEAQETRTCAVKLTCKVLKCAKINVVHEIMNKLFGFYNIHISGSESDILKIPFDVLDLHVSMDLMPIICSYTALINGPLSPLSFSPAFSNH